MNKDAESEGAKWAGVSDPLLRGSENSLESFELMKFLNLEHFEGDMSVVGPRPERPEFHHEFQKEIPFWSTRTLIKPGLTGWAQIRFRYAFDRDSSAKKLAYDLYYIKNASFFFDMEIILSTLDQFLKVADEKNFSYWRCGLHWQSYHIGSFQ